MRVLGLYSGRSGEIGEAICKTALLGAADAGCQIEAVNIRTLKLQPCTNCNACTNLIFGGSGDCVIKDDLPWLDEKIMQSDGILVVMPVFEKTPPGDFKILMDRMGPSHDIALRMIAKKVRQEKQITEEQSKGPDERSFKMRPAAFIAHGGTDWSGMALPVMEMWAVPMGFTVAAKALYEWNVDLVFQEEKLKEIYEIGKHLGKSTFLEPEKRIYKGNKGVCPVCHNNVMVMDEEKPVIQCAVCGVRGHLEYLNDEIRYVFTKEELNHSHMTIEGKMRHCHDLEENGKKLMDIGFGVLKAKKKELCNKIPTTAKGGSYE